MKSMPERLSVFLPPMLSNRSLKRPDAVIRAALERLRLPRLPRASSRLSGRSDAVIRAALAGLSLILPLTSWIRGRPGARVSSLVERVSLRPGSTLWRRSKRPFWRRGHGRGKDVILEALGPPVTQGLRRIGLEPRLGRRSVEAPRRGLVILAILLGAGAVWAWSRTSQRQTPKRRPDMPTLAGGRGVHVERTMTLRCSPEEAYRTWRDLEHLPRLLPGYLASVTDAGPGRTRWVVTGPGGVTVEWEAELTADEPERLLAWRSLPGAEVDIGGSVRFTPAPGGRGTELKVILTYSPPGRKLGAAAAALAGRGGDRLVREAIRRFKQMLETGEIAEAANQRDARSEARSTESLAAGRVPA
jgi:uncharacterized membrane protein